MNEGKFYASVNETVALLNDLGMLKHYDEFKRGRYSEQYFDISRHEDYLGIYNTIVNNQDYDIILYDDSVMQMSLGEYRFCFMQNPRNFVTFHDFLIDIGFCEEDAVGITQEEYSSEYEQYLTEQRLNDGAVYIRYDADETCYRTGCHPYTHMHIGLNNNIRIPVANILTPLAFTLLIIKQVYSDVWNGFYNNKQIYSRYAGKMKEYIAATPHKFLQPDDINELMMQ